MLHIFKHHREKIFAKKADKIISQSVKPYYYTHPEHYHKILQRLGQLEPNTVTILADMKHAPTVEHFLGYLIDFLHSHPFIFLWLSDQSRNGIALAYGNLEIERAHQQAIDCPMKLFDGITHYLKRHYIIAAV